MILYRWRGAFTNFGDELNTLLWPSLLPGFFDGDPTARFLGIGSVLDSRHPSQALKLVAGSGYGGYQAKPRLDQSWVIHWVRGPQTAAALGVAPSLALGDPAIMLPAVLDLQAGQGTAIGFMPHFETAARGGWRQAAREAGMMMIDPRDPPLDVLRAMTRCRLILSEALHGIIVADALRIPWIPICPIARAHRGKWADWSATMTLSPRFAQLPASTWAERTGAGRLARLRPARIWLSRLEAAPPVDLPPRVLDRCVCALAQAARMEPQLSDARSLDRVRSGLLEATRRLARSPFPDAALPAQVHEERSGLQRRRDSAYELPVTG